MVQNAFFVLLHLVNKKPIALFLIQTASKLFHQLSHFFKGKHWLIFVLTAFVLFLIAEKPALAQGLLSDEMIKQGLKAASPGIPLPWDSILSERINQSVLQGDVLLSTFYPLKPYYHFFEQELKKRAMPIELAYLPMAISRMQVSFQDGWNRAGVWGLSPAVAARGGLRITRFWDERMDVQLATPLALNELQRLFAKYKDWWPAIIAFCNGEAALTNAYIRMDTKQASTFDLYHKGGLPVKECIPDFITTIFTAAYALGSDFMNVDQKGIPMASIVLKNKVARKDMISMLGFSADSFRLFNPVFQSEVLEPHPHLPIVLPQAYLALFMPLEDSLYAAYRMSPDSLKIRSDKGQAASSQTAGSRIIIYTVKKGDVLGKIAEKHSVRVKQIIDWNKLKGDTIYPGQKLKIHKYK